MQSSRSRVSRVIEKYLHHLATDLRIEEAEAIQLGAFLIIMWNRYVRGAQASMAALSLDLRQRIISTCDRGEGTQKQIARRFGVSYGMVKKLLQQQRKTGCIKPRHHLAGRKKLIVAEHRMAIRQHLKGKQDMTLAELREALGLKCTLPAIHYVLIDMGLTYKKDAPRRRARPRRRPQGASKVEAQARRFRALEAGLPGRKRYKDQYDPAAWSAAACGSPLVDAGRARR